MNKGFSLIEVVIASSIITIGILALINSYIIYVNYALGNAKNVQAAYLMEEGLEAMTLIRDNGWTANIQPLSTTTTYYITYDSSSQFWKATTTVQYVDSLFLRTITLADVQRDSSGKIVSSGGTYDPNTKQVTVTLQFYQGQATTTDSMLTYLTNINGD